MGSLECVHIQFSNNQFSDRRTINSPGFLTLSQTSLLLGTVEMFVAFVSFVFAFYSYKLMENMAVEFVEVADNGQSAFLYSAFFIYDELFNCAIAVASFLTG